jgi:hypothetical protein
MRHIWHIWHKGLLGGAAGRLIRTATTAITRRRHRPLCRGARPSRLETARIKFEVKQPGCGGADTSVQLFGRPLMSLAPAGAVLS